MISPIIMLHAEVTSSPAPAKVQEEIGSLILSLGGAISALVPCWPSLDASDAPRCAAAIAQPPLEHHRWFGSVVSAAGDVDRDGTTDILVAEPGLYDCRGAVWAVSGRDGHTLHCVFGDAPGDGFGVDVRRAGDVDHDGHDDWIVGAGSRYSAERMNGYAIVYSGATGKPIHRFVCRATGDGFGSAVAGAGDVDKDGYADLVVGAYDADGSGDAMGVAYVFSGIDGKLLRVLGARGRREERGIDVAGVGDVNGDGFDDVAVSVMDESSPAHAAPEVRIYSGKDGALLFTAPSPSRREIRCVRAAGDADGDGTPDLVVGAIGGAALVSGKTGQTLERWSGSIDERFGWSVAAIRDADGDRFGDVLVSTPGAHVWGGRVEIFSGRTANRINAFYAADEVHHLGCSLDSLGDIDGDGFADVVLGIDHTGADDDGCVEVRSGRTGALIFALARHGDRVVALHRERRD